MLFLFHFSQWHHRYLENFRYFFGSLLVPVTRDEIQSLILWRLEYFLVCPQGCYSFQSKFSSFFFFFWVILESIRTSWKVGVWKFRTKIFWQEMGKNDFFFLFFCLVCHYWVSLNISECPLVPWVLSVESEQKNSKKRLESDVFYLQVVFYLCFQEVFMKLFTEVHEISFKSTGLSHPQI